jgi:hypothetical protein
MSERNYQNQFGPDWRVPSNILTLTWEDMDAIEDTSWGNDISPSFGVPFPHLGEDIYLRIWSDHPDPAMREFGDNPRFAINFTGMHAQEGDIMRTDDLDELIFCFRKSRLVVEVKRDVEALIRAEKMPPIVASFSQLHDFCDANTLGGTEKLLENLGLDLTCRICNAMQAEINAWLAAGRPETPWKMQERAIDPLLIQTLRYVPPGPMLDKLFVIDDGAEDERSVVVGVLRGPVKADIAKLNAEFLATHPAQTSKLTHAQAFVRWLRTAKDFTKLEVTEHSFDSGEEDGDDE